MFKMSSTRLHVLSQPLSKIRGQLRSAENFPVFSRVRLFIQKLSLASDIDFKKASCIAHRHDICRGIKFEELVVIVSSESFADSCMQALLSDMLNVR